VQGLEAGERYWSLSLSEVVMRYLGILVLGTLFSVVYGVELLSYCGIKVGVWI
jgi:hypothetical protein